MPRATQTRGEFLKQLRKSKGLSQTALAHAIGIRTQGTISAWENDKQEIEPENVLALARFFRVDPTELGYEIPSMVPTDELRDWLQAMHDATEERAAQRHSEVMEALRALRLDARG